MTLRNVGLGYGAQPLFDDVNLTIETGQRLCVIGRNGVGKSTLFKLLKGDIEPDHGEIERKSGLVVRQLIQEVPRNLSGSVHQVVMAGLGESGQWLMDYQHLSEQLAVDNDVAITDRLHHCQQKIEANQAWGGLNQVETILSKMKLDGDAVVNTLSGGMVRRVLLAQALVANPDILLLDEPTNHLDITAIEWLENFLQQYDATLLFITHDRRLLKTLATDIVEIDRRQLFHWRCGYQDYLERKVQQQSAQQKSDQEFDKKLAQEELWIRQGIKARRTRNEGRVRKLEEMRQLRQQRWQQPNQVKLQKTAVEASAKCIFEIDNLCYRIDNKMIIDHFSSIILRGDKIGIIGDNGCGKTTLLKLLQQKIMPSSGDIKQGARLVMRYFDQQRQQLDLDKTVVDNIADGREFIEINGRSIHVLSYLRDFLFEPSRARTLVSALSGGERNRLLLAKLFTQPANVLIMDEPTNDLDAETLELLEQRLVDYPATLLLVSHDRDFLDNVVTSTIVFSGHGKVEEFVGGYSDYLRQRKLPEMTPPKIVKKKSGLRTTPQPAKLSYQQQRQLAKLPQQIEKLEMNIGNLQKIIAAPDFYQQAHDEVNKIVADLSDKELQLKALYQQWESLEDLMTVVAD